MTTSATYTYQQVARAIEHLTANFRDQPSLAELADQANVSTYHFQRLFTEWAGISPKKFLQYLTLSHAKQQLRNGVPLAEAAYETGLSGTGRLHDLFVTIEGITPGQFKQLGSGLVLTYGVFDSPFGRYVLGTITGKICQLQFLDEDEDPSVFLRAEWPGVGLQYDADSLKPLADQVFPTRTEPGRLAQPLSVLVKGSPFQVKVWEALLRIPEGRLASYDQIAGAIGMPSASRAVGTAIGSNPVGYLIPCHRVIRKTGLFGGYRWGTTRKNALIGWEAARINA